MSIKRSLDDSFKKEWNTLHVERREGYSTSVTDFHEHDFYEINLILSGNFKILLKDHFEKGSGTKIVLTRPHTPHYISCESDVLYSRTYLLFSEEFIANFIPEWKRLCAIFEENGTIITPTAGQAGDILRLIEQIEGESSVLGQRLLVYYLLLRLGELAKPISSPKEKPSYVFDALIYMEENYSQSIDFSLLAKKFCVGRTKMMTEFKLYVGSTMGDYLCRCRLKNALRCLDMGQTVECAAEACGFSDSSSLTRAFKRVYGMPPHRYMKSVRDENF